VRTDVKAVCLFRRVRTSSGMFLNRGEDEIIDRIESRIAKYTAIPKENGEGLQILHYQV
jgi:prolyl 4-hydroxylase